MNLAFSVGCSEYADPIPNLRYAARDAQRFASLMSSACGLREEEIRVFSDLEPDLPSPTFTSVLRQVAAGEERVRRGLNVDILFFFSGHGYHSARTGEDYLLLSDSVPGNFDRTALRMNEVVTALLGWEPRQLVLFIDACRERLGDDKAAGPGSDMPVPDVASLQPSGHVTFCSCAPHERSFESEQIQSGVFTEALCEALSDQGRCRTLNELNAYLVERVPVLSRSLGKPEQNPSTRLEPPEILHLEIVSAEKRNLWRSQVGIKEEIRPRVTSVRTSRPRASALGVDFGTCNSLVASWDGHGSPSVVPNSSGLGLTPSVVNFAEDLTYYVGVAAIERESLGVGVTVRYPKRYLGSSRQFDVFGHSITPEFATSLVLRSLRRDAEEHVQNVPRPVVGYPELFSLAQYNSLAEAFELAE